jgi:hypothetical protein
MPKFTFTKLEDIPETLRGEAKETEDKKGFEIELVSGTFRDKNIEVSRERDQLKTVVEGYKSAFGDDPNAVATELKEARVVVQQVKDGKIKATDAIDAEVNRRTESVKTELGAQIKALSEKLAESDSKLTASEQRRKSMIVRQKIAEVVMDPANGANPAAIADFEARGLNVFRVKDDDTLVAMQGDAMIYGADGTSSMSPKEWLAKVLKDSPYLAKSSSGGGAGGEGNGKGVYGTNFDEKTWASMSPADRMREGRKARAAQG